RLQQRRLIPGTRYRRFDRHPRTRLPPPGALWHRDSRRGARPRQPRLGREGRAFPRAQAAPAVVRRMTWRSLTERALTLARTRVPPAPLGLGHDGPGGCLVDASFARRTLGHFVATDEQSPVPLRAK